MGEWFSGRFAGHAPASSEAFSVRAPVRHLRFYFPVSVDVLSIPDLVCTDLVLVWVALLLSFVIRLGVEDVTQPLFQHTWLLIAAPVVAIPLFIRFGMYRAVMRYFGNDALIAIIKAVSLSALILAFVVYWHFHLQPAYGVGRFSVIWKAFYSTYAVCRTLRT